MLGHFCSKIICFSLSCADNYIQVECLNWLHFQKKYYVLKLYFYSKGFGQWCRKGRANQDIWWIFLWGVENIQTDGFFSPILFNIGRKYALLPQAFAPLLLWLPKEKRSLFKTKYLFTESSEADSSELYILSKMLIYCFGSSLFWALKGS